MFVCQGQNQGHRSKHRVCVSCSQVSAERQPFVEMLTSAMLCPLPHLISRCIVFPFISRNKNLLLSDCAMELQIMHVHYNRTVLDVRSTNNIACIFTLW